MEKINETVSILNTFASLSLSATNLDFGPEFAKNKEPGEYVSIINQYLQLHEGNKINRFHIFFTPLEIYASDLENWIAFAVQKEVEILDFSTGLDWEKAREFLEGGNQFKLPSFIFSCKTLTSLTLSLCDFNLPEEFTGFNHLKSLSLSYVTIPNDALQKITPHLENLFINFCINDDILKIASQTLQKLVIVNPWLDICDIEINTPQLNSFIYYGMHIFGQIDKDPRNRFVDISSLTDAYITSQYCQSSEPWHDYIKLLFELKQVKVLTLCSATPLNATIYGNKFGHGNLPVMLENLKELQLLVETMGDDDPDLIDGFFHYCPSPYLEKLFIHLPCSDYQLRSHLKSEIEMMEVSSDVSFKYLKTIKIINFRGIAGEMKLLRYLLKRAFILETMMIVFPSDNLQEEHKVGIIDEKNIYEQILLLPKASLAANIVFFDSLKDDNSLKPTHTEYLHELI